MTQRHRQASTRSRVTSKITAIGALFGVAALIVSTSVPAAVLYDADSAAARTSSALRASAPAQSFAASFEASLAAPTSAGRDGYAISPPPPPPPVRVTRMASFAPRGSLLYTPNPNGTIQWPFTRYVPIASGFGARSAPCGGCSSFHDGIDMLAGGGAPIGAIAPGVVTSAGDDGGAYGTRVTIEHVVNGQRVKSLYAHMIAGSTTVSVGQTVTVGQIIGLVGSTGASTGAHLHLGLSLDGASIDPYAWLIANAN
ncbi:M23 family metallopeptidase [Frigoribacterium sp. CG_9.8]|uniref:M23 family metallopeptidase n=1 Tax=Frigoribacterium sp. CG_9.8 TaxID=2787733 RepID=UPI0018CAB34B|nr:murein DD-endopeptidase MepM/ murein hydrolase activator NlpD [Frigoribacterium sp. CG_9.8]